MCPGRSGVSTAGHGPIIFGDAAPEEPDADDRQEIEKRLKHGSVDFAADRIADVRADDKVEDLADGKQEGGSREVDWHQLAQTPVPWIGKTYSWAVAPQELEGRGWSPKRRTERSRRAGTTDTARRDRCCDYPPRDWSRNDGTS